MHCPRIELGSPAFSRPSGPVQNSYEWEADMITTTLAVLALLEC